MGAVTWLHGCMLVVLVVIAFWLYVGIAASRTMLLPLRLLVAKLQQLLPRFCEGWRLPGGEDAL
jgi:hypothetical protein